MTRELSPELLRTLLRYEPETGKLFWLRRDVSLFRQGKIPAEQACRIWNTRYAEKEAFTANSRGYRVGGIFGRTYEAHRVIWVIVNGEWPTDKSDHENGVRNDNRIVNLRDVTTQENGKNSKLPISNTSGVIGVGWRPQRSKWRASIKAEGRSIHLGYFADFDSAVAARKSAEIKYGFHPNHGRAGGAHA